MLVFSYQFLVLQDLKYIFRSFFASSSVRPSMISDTSVRFDVLSNLLRISCSLIASLMSSLNSSMFITPFHIFGFQTTKKGSL